MRDQNRKGALMGLLVELGVLALLVTLYAPAAKADALGGITISGTGSTGEFYFSPGAGADYLNMQITGCSTLPPTCTPDGGINGTFTATIDGFAVPWAYTIDAGTFPGQLDTLAFPSGPSDWFLSGSTGFSLIDTNSSPINFSGTIDWTKLSESGGVDSISGSLNWTFSLGGSGSDPFNVALGPLTCTGLPSGTPCSLTEIAASDPIYGTAPLGCAITGASCTESTPPPSVPEPASGTLLLLGLGALGLLTLWRRNHRCEAICCTLRG